jgi:serine/threonine protein kinase
MQSPYLNRNFGEVNSSVKNNYSLISLIGKGSFGSVYLAKNKQTNEQFACKKMKICLRRMYDKQAILNELKLLACHKCQYIIKLVDAYVTSNHIHLITEYAERGDLSKMIKRLKTRNRYLIEDTVKKYLFQICLGIQYLHNNNVIHRDIKAANIFLTKDNNIKLGDVGIVKILKSTNNYAYTNIGTPYYMSPELYKNKRYNSKTDIWSIGVVLYELMTFKLPYDANNIAGLKYKISNQDWFMENKYKDRYSKELNNLLKNILHPQQFTRYNITQILESPYFYQEYNLIRNDLVKPFSQKFFSNALVPINKNDWNKVIKKYVSTPPKIQAPSPPPLPKLPPIKDAEGYKTKALKIIDKMDELMLHINSDKFRQYSSLKREIKEDLNNYRVKCNKY